MQTGKIPMRENTDNRINTKMLPPCWRCNPKEFQLNHFVIGSNMAASLSSWSRRNMCELTAIINSIVYKIQFEKPVKNSNNITNRSFLQFNTHALTIVLRYVYRAHDAAAVNLLN